MRQNIAKVGCDFKQFSDLAGGFIDYRWFGEHMTNYMIAKFDEIDAVK